MKGSVTKSVTLTIFGEKYKLKPHCCCGILSSRHLLSLGGNILIRHLLAF